MKPVQEAVGISVDVDLLERIGRRDRAAFAQLYDRYAGILFSASLRILNDSKEAEETLQEIFLEIWDTAKTFNSKRSKPFNWILSLARAKAIERLRALRRTFSFVKAVSAEASLAARQQGNWNDDLCPPETRTAISNAVETLPLEQRQAIEMAFLGRMTHEEISRNLEQPVATIKGRIRRGLLTLRDSLEGQL